MKKLPKAVLLLSVLTIKSTTFAGEVQINVNAAPSSYPSITDELVAIVNPPTDFSFNVLIPTAAPTPYARDVFTPSPTINQSVTPSSYPTIQDSAVPSTIPSASPSSTPSAEPSDDPSSLPSSTPSSTPSALPSSTPSALPTSSPTVTPSQVPSVSPSTTPSFVPTSSPSVTPSSDPSDSPTQIPSINPTPSVLLVQTSVTLWGITVGNSKSQISAFEDVTRDFLNKHITINGSTNTVYQTDEIRKLQDKPLSVTIIDVDLVQQIRDGEYYNVDSDGQEAHVDEENQEGNDDGRDQPLLNENDVDIGGSTIGAIDITEDGFLIGIRVAPKNAGDELIGKNAAVVKVHYEVTPYNPPESFDYMDAAFWGFKYEMSSYQKIIFTEHSDVLGIAGLIAADSMRESNDSVTFSFVDGVIVVSGLIAICAIGYIYYQRKMNKDNKKKVQDSDGRSYYSTNRGDMSPDLTFSGGHDFNDGGFRLNEDNRKFGCTSNDMTEVMNNRQQMFHSPRRTYGSSHGSFHNELSHGSSHQSLTN